MNGMNLSGKPGIVHAMQMPPTLGQPPIPSIQPRLGTLQLTTGGSVSSAATGAYGSVIRKLRTITNKTVNKEPKWRHNRDALTTGYDPRWRAN